MNCLVLSGDGPKSVGFQILLEAAKKVFLNKKVVGMYTHQAIPGVSFGMTVNKGASPGEPHVEIKSESTDVYSVKGTVVDALYVAVLFPERVIGVGPTFDVVLTGVNQGSNVGMDILHSGTTSVALLAASAFGLASMSFSQEVGGPAKEELEESHNSRKEFAVAEFFVERMLREAAFTPGTCVNVNFPRGTPKGYKRISPAPYSRWLPAFRMPHQENDISALEEGFITISGLELSLQPTMKY